MFGKLFTSAKKVQNNNIMEAIIAGSMLVAAADGSISRPEVEKVERLIMNNDNLSAFKPAEMRKVIQRYQNILEADFGVGQKKMLDEISDISDNNDFCEEVMLNILAVAKSDGTISPEELKVIEKVSQLLGFNVKDFDL